MAVPFLLGYTVWCLDAIGMACRHGNPYAAREHCPVLPVSNGIGSAVPLKRAVELAANMFFFLNTFIHTISIYLSIFYTISNNPNSSNTPSPKLFRYDPSSPLPYCPQFDSQNLFSQIPSMYNQFPMWCFHIK